MTSWVVSTPSTRCSPLQYIPLYEGKKNNYITKNKVWSGYSHYMICCEVYLYCVQGHMKRMIVTEMTYSRTLYRLWCPWPDVIGPTGWSLCLGLGHEDKICIRRGTSVLYLKEFELSVMVCDRLNLFRTTVKAFHVQSYQLFCISFLFTNRFFFFVTWGIVQGLQSVNEGSL